MAMARKSRIDAPGALSQIIVRRIERREKWGHSYYLNLPDNHLFDIVW
jgi:hypothetical protein